MSKLYSVFVPDDGPLESNLWLVGESPGSTEEVEKKPFVGEAGQILLDVLRNHGLDRSQVRLANLCHFRPFGNDFKNCVGSRELADGVALLYEQINTFKPTCIVALGSYVLSYLTDRYGIEAHRGSILPYKRNSKIKVVAARHPAAIARDRKEFPIFDFDIGRAVNESQFKEFNYPQYEFVIDPQGLEKEEWTTRLCNNPTFISCDIENIRDTTKIICVGFGISPTQAVVYPWNDENIPHIQRILSSKTEKCFHFGTHDTTVFEENGLQTNNYSSDTMALQHVLNPELPRSLAFLTSIHTRQPYYKAEGRGTLPNNGKGWSVKTDLQKLYAYNGTDCCVTWDAAFQLKQELQERPHLIPLFDYEMEMIEVARSISRAGMLIDQERRFLLLNTAIMRWRKRQGMFNYLASFYDNKWIVECNVNSHKQMKELLYDNLKLPVKKKRDGRITTDEDALVELLTHVKTERIKVSRKDAVQRWTEKETLVSTVIEIRGLRKLISSYLKPKISSDGRLRSTLKVCSVETGRWAAEKFVDDTGVNQQTFPREGLDISEEDFLRIADVKPTVEEIKQIESDLKEEESEIFTAEK